MDVPFISPGHRSVEANSACASPSQALFHVPKGHTETG